VDVRLCKFQATSVNERQFRFKAADCEAITDERGLVDWHDLFSRKGVDIFYDVIWTSMGDERTECIEKQGNKSGLKDERI
jgi:hypothetical protein